MTRGKELPLGRSNNNAGPLLRMTRCTISEASSRGSTSAVIRRSKPRRSSVPIKERRSGKGGRSRCVRRRGCVSAAELRRGAAGLPSRSSERLGFGGLAYQKAGSLGLTAFFAGHRLTVPAVVEGDESCRGERPVAREQEVSASRLGVILEAKQHFPSLPGGKRLQRAGVHHQDVGPRDNLARPAARRRNIGGAPLAQTFLRNARFHLIHVGHVSTDVED